MTVKLQCLPRTPHALSAHTLFLLSLSQHDFSKEPSTDLTIKTSATSSSLITIALNPPILHYSPTVTSDYPTKAKAEFLFPYQSQMKPILSPPNMILSMSVIPQSYLMYLFTISHKHFKLNTLKTKFITSYLFIKTYFS